MSNYFVLPDHTSICAIYKSGTNPHYDAVAQESREWINSFDFFPDKKRLEFRQGQLLASHSYHYAGYNEFRVCCDFLNLLFVIDEISDKQSRDAQETGDIYVRTMHGSNIDEGTKLYQVTKEFREHLLQCIGPRSFQRFVQHCENYISAVATEARLREEEKIPSIKDFIPLRRENSAIRCGLDLIEVCLGIDLPDFVFEDPAVQQIYWAGVDLVCWQNDLYSYSMEVARGLSGSNMVTVLMQELGVDVQGAVNYLGELCKGLVVQYGRGRENLPFWGPEIDVAVARYADAVGCWVRGNIDWSFETPRYFGQDALEVKRTRIVKLPSGPRDGTENVESVM
ncbi:isoprenoid synthase domain-containing protein [Schizophyllum commune]